MRPDQADSERHLEIVAEMRDDIPRSGSNWQEYALIFVPTRIPASPDKTGSVIRQRGAHGHFRGGASQRTVRGHRSGKGARPAGSCDSWIPTPTVSL